MFPPLILRRSNSSLSRKKLISLLNLISTSDSVKLGVVPPQPPKVDLAKLEHRHFDGVAFALNHIREHGSNFRIDYKKFTLNGVPLADVCARSNDDALLVRVFDELLLTGKLSRHIFISIILNPHFKSMNSVLKKLKRSTMFLSKWSPTDKCCVELAICSQKYKRGQDVGSVVAKRTQAWLKAIHTEGLLNPFDRIVWQLLFAHMDVPEIISTVRQLYPQNNAKLLFSAWQCFPQHTELLTDLTGDIDATRKLAVRLSSMLSDSKILQLVAECTRHSPQLDKTIARLRWSDSIKTLATELAVYAEETHDANLFGIIDELNELDTNTLDYQLKAFAPLPTT